MPKPLSDDLTKLAAHLRVSRGLLFPHELAAVLNVDRATVDRAKAAGQIPYHRLNERVIFFVLDEVLAATKERGGEPSALREIGGGRS